MKKKYPFIKQEGPKDCGVASILMLIKYYNGSIPIEELREMTKTNKNGTTAYHLTQTLNQIGFESYGVKCELDDFNEDNIVLPCVASVTINKSYKHFIVIYEINYKKKYLLIADPGVGIKRIKFSEFQKIYNNVLIFAQPVRTLPIINEHNYLYIKKILVNHKNLLCQLIILSIFITLFSIIGSFFMKFMIDAINTKAKYYLIYIFIIFFSINLLKIITDYFRNTVLIYVNQKIDLDLTIDTFSKILKLPYHYYRNRTTGEMISRINDLSLVRDIITKVAVSLFIDLPLAISTLVILYIVSNKLFVIGIIIMILYVLIILCFKSTYQQLINEVQESRAIANSYMVESISGFETVKGIHVEKQIINKFTCKYAKFLKSLFNYQKCYFLQHSLKEIVNEIGFLFIILFGSILVIVDNMTIGSLLTFNALLSYFLDPIRNIIDLDSNIKESKNAIKRISQIVNRENKNGIINKQLIGDIEFKHLTYSFNDRDIILNNTNLKINSGSKVMVIGKSGSGKSTMFKILLKYYSVSNNKVFINGIDINNLTFDSIDQSIVYVGQNEILFNDTVYNNINIANNDQNKFLRISKMCYIDEVVNNDLGYNNIIEENGFNLSGGQRQRIMLARALLMQFNILIIDEALNQVDLNLERKILKNIFEYYKDKTIIFISHRTDNIDLFDKLVEVFEGKIVRSIDKFGKQCI